MGHRALVAYERTDGQYTLHYSHWGAANLKLKHRISAESPFGGEDTDTKWAKQLLAELADGLEADAVDGYLAGEDRLFAEVEADINLAVELVSTPRPIEGCKARVFEHFFELPAGHTRCFSSPAERQIAEHVSTDGGRQLI
ncbi:hypothetical protein HLASF_0856 [Halanaeroarchaeum sulfurireducens]|uniref:Uncharacterized protein n=1 Tax=Halanaeroarchaeum sulfurireducens TaxID=1604004 RepID=A0A0F7PCI0_9EURY|nr:hypothetical protein HLASF_0856 [Halanaeroarchaeum sulfurireducens]ALG81751.1 hypothetical protein HLASA_0853 [Halanaeroarchaeum sulfurireducens]